MNEVLGSGRKHSIMDMMRLQTDYLSIPARTLVPLLANVTADAPEVERARRLLLEWDYVLHKTSAAAAVYAAWEENLRRNVRELFVPQNARSLIRISFSGTIDRLIAPPAEFGPDPLAGRDNLLVRSLAEAVRTLEQRLGPDPDSWQKLKSSVASVIKYSPNHLLRKKLPSR